MKTENILILADDIITSPSYSSIASLIDGFPNLTQNDKEDIKGIFQEINVADAQAIRSMDSFRSIMDMMGRWDDRMEEALSHFKEGTWTREDFDIIYQTIKPFVYAVIDRNDGLGNKIAVPQQNKNSEICALMMYDLISNSLGKSDVYVALSEFMDETRGNDGKTLIHMCGYESMGKVGNQGVINISVEPNKIVKVLKMNFSNSEKDLRELFEKADLYPGYIEYKDKSIESLPNDIDNAIRNFCGEKYNGGEIKDTIKQQLDKKLDNKELTQEEYNKIISYLRPTKDQIKEILRKAALVTNPDGSVGINEEVVHTIPMDNYYQAQPTPEHHIDAEATFGSQARNINIADLPEDFEITLKGKNGKPKTYKGRDAVIDFYYELLNENLIEDFFGITDENGNLKRNKKGEPIKAGLKTLFASKENLRDAITEIVRGNPKYGNDFADALELDSEGNFVLSPNSPTMFNLTQEIITSFFKNRITKQTINGAALIQAAGIGLDENLRVLTDEKTGRVIGAECYMPLTSRKFFEPLLEEKIVNGKKVMYLDPQKLKDAGLDEAVGYRIPTENKSSMMPLIIKGFTPLQNGSVIVLPAEITAIAGSDFDVDKMFIMLLSFNLISYDKKKAFNDYVAQEHEAAQEIINALGKANIEDLEIEEIGKNFSDWFEDHKEDYKYDKPRIRKIEYDFNKTPKQNGRKARNNMLIQLMYGILTSKEGSEQLMNPQGFKDFKHAAKVNCILSSPILLEKLIQERGGALEGVVPSTDNIRKEFLDMVKEKYPYKFDAISDMVRGMTDEQVMEAYMKALNPNAANEAIAWLLDPNTDTGKLEKFINENSPAESPIYPQTFAHSHARNMAGTNQIGIYALQCSMAAKYQRASVVMRQEHRFMLNGREINQVDVSEGGKRLKNGGQMVGASADNGKDANLSDAGSTSKTAPIIGYMLRAGLSHLEAVLLINQPIMINSGYTTRAGDFKMIEKNIYNNHPSNITTEMLIKNIINPYAIDNEVAADIDRVCYRILKQAETQEYLTQISRADSPNGSIKHTYAKARIQMYKVDLFQGKMGQDDFPFIRINEALSNDAVDTSADENTVRAQVNSQRMGFLHAMYALGIHSFNDLVAPYFFGARKNFDENIVKPILYNLNEKMSDEKKEQIVNNIYTSYITFVLSNSPIFGNEENADGTTYSMKEKREYYLKTFPSDYLEILANNKDIRDILSSMLQVIQTGNVKRIVLKDASSVGKKQRADLQRRFEKLAYSENEAARKLAADLFIYSYFDNGLNFRHDSFSHLFSTKFLLNFPVYNEALRQLDSDLSDELNKRFLEQFLVTFPEATYPASFVDRDKHVFNNGDTLMLPLNDRKIRRLLVNAITSPQPKRDGIHVHPYLNYNGRVYMLREQLFESDPSQAVYDILPEYPSFPKLPLFSMQMSAAEMAEEFKDIVPEDYDDGIPEGQSFNDPYVGDNTFSPDFGDSLGDSFSGAGIDFYIQPVSNSNKFHNEGEGELQSPFC